MKHKTNPSSGRKERTVFTLILRLFIVAVVIGGASAFAYYATNKQSTEEEIVIEDNQKEQANNVVVFPTNIPVPESTQEPVLPTPTPKPYVYYYINDNGYKSYLDNQYQDYLYEMCVKYNVTEYYTLFIAQMYHESSFNINNISKTHDYGLMQINKCNHKWLGKILGNNDFLDPYNNIEAGVYMMSNFLNKYQDVQKALVCYNRGEGAVKKGTYSTSYSRGVLEDMNLLVKID